MKRRDPYGLQSKLSICEDWCNGVSTARASVYFDRPTASVQRHAARCGFPFTAIRDLKRECRPQLSICYTLPSRQTFRNGQVRTTSAATSSWQKVLRFSNGQRKRRKRWKGET
jgi:hypothetical protein